MEKLFENNDKSDGRKILIKIKGGEFCFYFYNDYQKEEDSNEFYYLSVEKWHKDKTRNIDSGGNIHNHMKLKKWFSEEMEKFMNENSM